VQVELEETELLRISGRRFRRLGALLRQVLHGPLNEVCQAPHIVQESLTQRLLVQAGGLAGVDRASLEELGKVSGIGRVKGIEIKAALELGRRLDGARTGAAAGDSLA